MNHVRKIIPNDVGTFCMGEPLTVTDVPVALAWPVVEEPVFVVVVAPPVEEVEMLVVVEPAVLVLVVVVLKFDTRNQFAA